MNKTEKILYTISEKGAEKLANRLAPSLNLITFQATVVVGKHNDVTILLMAVLDKVEHDMMSESAQERFDETINCRVASKMEAWAKRIAKLFRIDSLTEAVNDTIASDWDSGCGLFNSGTIPFTYDHFHMYLNFEMKEE